MNTRTDTDDLTLTGATIARSYGTDSPLKIYDDGFGRLYVYGHEFGPTLVIRALSYEDAYGIAIDESPTISADDMHEAYGFDTADEYQRKVDAGDTDDLELAEGYQYQGNATDTGIVFEGWYAWLKPLTLWNESSDEKITPIFADDDDNGDQS